jgi:NAD(P)-dependent dehydrogenase (short-subunit alcohol dehydrogenase family)
MALRFLQAGHQVVIADHDAEACSETTTAYARFGPIHGIAVDVGDEAAVRALIDETVARFGGLDHLINNAAILRNKPLAELSLADWNAVLATNLTGPFLCSKYAAPHLASRRGSIVNLTSTRAHMSEPNTEAYSASKGGLLALTHALAISLGPAVRVNAVSPGWIEVGDWQAASHRHEPALRSEDHAQHPVGRVGRPEDIAEMVLFLCSGSAGFVTGQEFIVDGGMTRKMIYVD